MPPAPAQSTPMLRQTLRRCAAPFSSVSSSMPPFSSVSAFRRPSSPPPSALHGRDCGRPRASSSLLLPHRRRPVPGPLTSVAAAAAQRCRALSFSYPAPRTLDEVVKLDLLASEDPERVQEIWKEYHDAREDAVGETWSVDEFAQFRAQAAGAAMFVFPVERDDGQFVMLSQVQEKHCLYTFLDEYKQDPLGASPWMSVTFYDELAEDKSLVLVRGDVTQPHLTLAEGRHLLELTKHYYLERPDDIDCFNNRPAEFDVLKHLAECPARPPTEAGDD